jgi:ABC-type amino acid transport substrate-binding protein
MTTLRRPLLAAAFAVLAGTAFAQQTLPPLRTGVDGTYAPHAMPKLGGGVEGFQIDLFNEVARRMHRDIVIESASFSGLIPALQSGRYDFLTAPTTVTPERAQALLFTQGYLWTAFQFGIRKGSAPLKGWEDLKGKVVSVNKGTPYETLSKKMGEQYGFTVQTFDTEPDAVQAVVSGLCQSRGQHGDQVRSQQEPAIRSRPAAERYQGALGRTVPQGRGSAARRGGGRAEMHEEGRHGGEAVGEMVRLEAGAG